MDEEEKETSTEQARRSELLQQMKEGLARAGAMVAVIKCYAATQERDADNYDVLVFKRSLDDAADVDLELAPNLLMKYVERS